MLCGSTSAVVLVNQLTRHTMPPSTFYNVSLTPRDVQILPQQDCFVGDMFRHVCQKMLFVGTCLSNILDMCVKIVRHVCQQNLPPKYRCLLRHVLDMFVNKRTSLKQMVLFVQRRDAVKSAGTIYQLVCLCSTYETYSRSG